MLLRKPVDREDASEVLARVSRLFAMRYTLDSVDIVLTDASL